MTKEDVFRILEKNIHHISENFNAEEVDVLLTDPLRDSLPPFEFSVDAGISKAVIIIKGAEFVIKIPFYKWYDECAFDCDISNWEVDRDEYLSLKAKEKGEDYVLSKAEIVELTNEFIEEHPMPEDDERYYYDLYGANNIDLDGAEEFLSETDYCALECIIYDLAEAAGLGAYFAEEGVLGEIDNTPIYYQTRCTPMRDMDINYNSRENMRKSDMASTFCEKHDIGCFNDIWIADFIETYGEEELIRLNKFLDKYEIGDLRTANIGYLDGAPILFDYSGYRDW